jgi:hypothetical protein
MPFVKAALALAAIFLGMSLGRDLAHKTIGTTAPGA